MCSHIDLTSSMVDIPKKNHRIIWYSLYTWLLMFTYMYTIRLHIYIYLIILQFMMFIFVLTNHYRYMCVMNYVVTDTAHNGSPH